MVEMSIRCSKRRKKGDPPTKKYRKKFESKRKRKEKEKKKG